MFGPVWTPTGTTPARRFVAALDILGFKQRLQREGAARLFSDYDRLRKAASATARISIGGVLFGQAIATVQQVPYIVLSDTILLWADEGPNVSSLITSCCALVAESVRHGMPLRGGIALGDVIIDPATLTFLGQPLVDAYLTEGLQEWVGVAVHASATSALASVEDVVNYAVPVKSKAWKVRAGLPANLRKFVPRVILRGPLSHALCWHHYLHASEALEHLDRLGRAAGSNRVKYENAAEFVRAFPLD